MIKEEKEWVNEENKNDIKINVKIAAVVVAQLVERLLLKPKVIGLNPVIGKNLYIYLYWKDKNKEKEAVNDPFFKKIAVMFLR